MIVPRPVARVLAFGAALLLGACATQPLVIDDPDWLRHEAAVSALRDWELVGRLNVRQNGASDTVNINWQQLRGAFDLRLSGSLGLGAVRVSGDATQVSVERNGETAVNLPDLAAVTREYFGYEFPTAQLLYWVRGLPAPQGPGSSTLDDNRMLATLRQSDAAGASWDLRFENYRALAGGEAYLPGRIHARSAGLELTFLVSEWRRPETSP
jgi:outer membrane lipoprotein LolB